MEDYAARLLKLALENYQRASVSEIRFISGMMPAFVDDQGPHFLEAAYLSKELVVEVHNLCRLLADQPVKGSGAARTYTFVLRGIGRLRCKYQRRGNVASLVLARDADAEETIDAIRAKKPGKGN